MRDGSKSENPSPSTVHTNLDHSHELHEVRDSLPDAVGGKKDRSRRGHGQTLVSVNQTVAVLVEASAARSEGHWRANGSANHQRAKRAETVPDAVDGDSGDPMRRHRGGDVKAEILVLGASVAENCHWPTGGRLGA